MAFEPTFSDLLADLSGRGVKLWLEDGALRFRGPEGCEALPQFTILKERRNELRAHFEAQAADNLVPKIRSAPRSGPLPLTNAQKTWWTLEAVHGAISNFPLFAIRFNGILNADVLAACMREIVRRHEILRTRFWESSSHELLQQVKLSFEFNLDVIDIGNVDSNEAHDAVRAHLRQLQTAKYDLGAGHVLRAKLLRLGPNEHVFAVGIHHVAIDLWSWPLFTRELTASYAAFAAGQPSPLPDPPLQFGDYALWEAANIITPHLETNTSLWSRQIREFGGFELPTLVPLTRRDLFSRQLPIYCRRLFGFALPRELDDAIREMASTWSIPVQMTLIASFFLFLSQWTGSQRMLVGYFGTGRVPGVQRMLGSFLSIRPLFVSLEFNPTFRELIGQVQYSFACMHGTSHVVGPQTQIQGCLRQVLLHMVEVPEHGSSSTFVTSELSMDELESESASELTTSHEFQTFFTTTPSQILVNLVYAEELFDESSIREVPEILGSSLRLAIESPDIPLRDLLNSD